MKIRQYRIIGRERFLSQHLLLATMNFSFFSFIWHISGDVSTQFANVCHFILQCRRFVSLSFNTSFHLYYLNWILQDRAATNVRAVHLSDLSIFSCAKPEQTLNELLKRRLPETKKWRIKVSFSEMRNGFVSDLMRQNFASFFSFNSFHIRRTFSAMWRGKIAKLFTHSLPTWTSSCLRIWISPRLWISFLRKPGVRPWTICALTLFPHMN